jgi:NADH:ubiquinone reductase (non-electrogenic)
VRKVEEGSLTLTDGTTIPFGLCIWSTGVGPTEFTLSLPFAKTQVGAPVGAPGAFGVCRGAPTG